MEMKAGFFVLVLIVPAALFYKINTESTTNALMLQTPVLPLIVTWTKHPNNCDLEFERLRSTGKSCSYQCKLTDRERLNNRTAAAYLIHGRYMNVFDLPRKSEHLKVLWLREAPTRIEAWGNQIYEVTRGYFNATITYRKDSRYFYPYGQFEARTINDPVESIITQNQLLTALKRKTKGSLVFIANCKTPKRENIIRVLNKFTEITARGKCEESIMGNNSATRSASCKFDCKDDELIATHRFYLSFENSICEEYVTGMFYHRISQLLLPIVLKRQIYREAGIPDHSFIAVDDFNSLESLRKYLNYLRSNDAAYLRSPAPSDICLPNAKSNIKGMHGNKAHHLTKLSRTPMAEESLRSQGCGQIEEASRNHIKEGKLNITRLSTEAHDEKKALAKILLKRDVRWCIALMVEIFASKTRPEET